MTDSNFRKRYLEALGIQEDASGRSKLVAALQRAHEIRKFEIDLYWKRAAYFWALEAAAFVAFAAFWRSNAVGAQLLAVAFAGIGVVTGYVGWLSALGSKFWQENWEKHIDLLEREFEGHLHKTIWIAEGKREQFSVSRLNKKLNQIFFLFWLILFVTVIAYVSASAYGFKSILQPSPCLVVSIMFLMFFATVGSLYYLYCTRTNLEGGRYEIKRRLGPDEM